MQQLLAAHQRHLNRQLPKRAIVSFKPAETKPSAMTWWVDLQCGHQVSLCHQPPLFSRPWLMHGRWRRAMIGCLLPCRQCA